MRTLEIYFAGKISKNCWRHQLVPNLREYVHKSNFKFNTLPVDLKPLKIEEKFNYNGPWFISCDHGCYHGKGTHGRGNIKYKDNFCIGDTKNITSKEIIRLCKQGITSSDFIFCYLDSNSAYGTLFELGYAKAKNKPIFICCDSNIDKKEFWFILNSADKVIFTDNLDKAWLKFKEFVN